MIFCKDPVVTPLMDPYIAAQATLEPLPVPKPRPPAPKPPVQEGSQQAEPQPGIRLEGSPLEQDADFPAEAYQTPATTVEQLPQPKGTPKPEGPTPVFYVGQLTNAIPVFMIANSDGRKVMVTLTRTPSHLNQCFLAGGLAEKPGRLMMDSGCFRELAGDEHHEALKLYLRRFGLRPLEINKCEEFIFANTDTEFSHKCCLYPVIMGKKFCDVIDIAAIKSNCPPLLSKTTMEKWDVDLSFGKQMTHVGKFGFEYPFHGKSAYVDLFDMGDPETFDRNQVPKCFWLTDTPDPKADALAFNNIKKHGVPTVFGRPPSAPPRFPMRTTREDGYGSKKSGYDDSRRSRHSSEKNRSSVRSYSKDSRTNTHLTLKGTGSFDVTPPKTQPFTTPSIAPQDIQEPCAPVFQDNRVMSEIVGPPDLIPTSSEGSSDRSLSLPSSDEFEIINQQLDTMTSCGNCSNRHANPPVVGTVTRTRPDPSSSSSGHCPAQ